MEEEIRGYAIKAFAIVVLFMAMYTLFELYLMRNLVRKLNILAIKDPLTKLYSRRYLTESDTELLRKLHRNEQLVLSVIFMDIDHFKQVNDTYSHSAGDEVIAYIGDSIRSLSRADDIAFRYGGEEFLIISTSENPESAKLLTERIRQRIATHSFTYDNATFSVTISAGISIHTSDETLEATIARADDYLYQAKEAGRNRVVCKDTYSPRVDEL